MFLFCEINLIFRQPAEEVRLKVNHCPCYYVGQSNSQYEYYVPRPINVLVSNLININNKHANFWRIFPKSTKIRRFYNPLLLHFFPEKFLYDRLGYDLQSRPHCSVKTQIFISPCWVNLVMFGWFWWPIEWQTLEIYFTIGKYRNFW